MHSKKSGAKLDFKNPIFQYVYPMQHVKLLNDNDLMEMFCMLSEKKIIDIYVGTSVIHNSLYELLLKLREETQVENDNQVEDEYSYNSKKKVDDQKSDNSKGNEEINSSEDNDYNGESDNSDDEGRVSFDDEDI